MSFIGRHLFFLGILDHVVALAILIDVKETLKQKFDLGVPFIVKLH